MLKPLSLTLALTAPVVAAAQDVQPYIVGIVGSYHFGTDTLNNVNPGLVYGWRGPSRFEGWEQNWEIGVFYNSYEEVAPIAVYGLSREIARPSERVSLRAGGFVGVAYYETLSVILKREYDIPNIEGYIPIVGLSTVARIDDVFDIRITFVPPGAGVDLITNLSIAYQF